VVHPDHRRSGHGSDLLSFAEARARDLSRTSLGADAWDRPAAIAFAAAYGFEQKSAAINRRQELDRLDRRLVDKLHDEALAHASAYELIRIAGRTPDELMDAVATMTAAINDAPTDDLDIEDEVYPRERIEGYETAMLGRDRRFYRVVARHRETGELAGHTVVTVEAERPELGWQQDTSVVRAHRGHRLGLLVKSEMLRWLAEIEPGLKSLDTWNAESNDHMIEVNEQLGYHVVARALQFQRDVR
jgi:GNAT superfamily N-acetyltransferase